MVNSKLKTIKFLFFIFAIALFVFQTAFMCCAHNEKPSLKIILNNKKIVSHEKPVIHDDTAYISLRPICAALNASLNWSKYSSTAIIRHNKRVIRVQIKGDYVFVNNEKKGKGVIENERLMLPARLIADIFNLDIRWDDDFKTIILNTKGFLPENLDVAEILTENLPYTKEDIYWLSRIVNAEAEGESYISKLAVANVVINRQKHNNYPNTIRNVIFDRQNGVQFTPTANGAIYRPPSPESTAAAIDALEGKNNAQNILFFFNPKKSTSFWITKNRRYAFTLENHDFYY